MRRHLKPLALSVSKGKQGRFFNSLERCLSADRQEAAYRCLLANDLAPFFTTCTILHD
jgi:hypothetical protein